ncbi:MAG: dihydropteroate synthase [Bacteroides sp.]|jgi:dihydropteroate synthase|nr:dihydropteroate synthase [Bacteroides sp.]
MAKDTFFCPKKTLNLRGKIINLSSPLVMGIVNITPDSFYDGGKYSTTWDVVKHAERLLDEGAHILDLGAASSRPGSGLIDPGEEQERLLPVIKAILRRFPDTLLSVDTYNSETALLAVEAGAHMINDISAGNIDPAMFDTIARLQVPYVMMHMQGTPATMQQKPVYKDLIKEISLFFAERIQRLNALGVNDIIIDPGFGFGKTVEHNYQLLNQLDFFRVFELPLLVGVSRKSMITRVLGNSPAEALNGTTAINTLALLKGANILRVHDVREAVEAIKIIEMLKSQNEIA